MTADEIASCLERFEISVAIYSGKKYVYGPKENWTCKLDYTAANGTKLEIEKKAEHLNGALEAAWTALSDTAQFGFHMKEVLQIAAPLVEEYIPTTPDDEIPF